MTADTIDMIAACADAVAARFERRLAVWKKIPKQAGEAKGRRESQ